jgi:putative acetyltransferase
MIEIRIENRADVAAIQHVHQQAFHPSLDESRLVELLRQANKAPVSWVALFDGRIVGHILFSEIKIIPSPITTVRSLGLGPIGVLPAFQNQGIGSKLISHGLRDCQRSGYDFIVVLGDPQFYAAFGFVHAKAYQLGNEYGADEAFMVLELREGILHGIHGC